MKHISPGDLHVVIAERQDQVIGVCWTRSPAQHLANLSAATQIGRTEVRPSPYATRICKALSKRFADSLQLQGHECFWTSADFEEVIAALNEYDLVKGLLIERAGVRANDQVYIPEVGRGVVTGFTLCGRVIVKLDRGSLTKAIAIARRADVKPVVRAA